MFSELRAQFERRCSTYELAGDHRGDRAADEALPRLLRRQFDERVAPEEEAEQIREDVIADDEQRGHHNPADGHINKPTIILRTCRAQATLTLTLTLVRRQRNSQAANDSDSYAPNEPVEDVGDDAVRCDHHQQQRHVRPPKLCAHKHNNWSSYE